MRAVCRLAWCAALTASRLAVEPVSAQATSGVAALIPSSAPRVSDPTEPADTRAARLAFLAQDLAAGSIEDQKRARNLAWMTSQITDTVSIGGIRWHIAPSLRSVAEPTLRRVDDTLRARGIAPMATVLSVQDAWLFADAPPVGSWLQGPRRGRPTLMFSPTDRVDVSPLSGDVLMIALDRRLHAPLWAGVDQPLKRWASTAPSQFTNSVFGAVELRNMLASMADPRGPACAAGDIDACHAGLFNPDASNGDFSGPLRSSLITAALGVGGARAMQRLLADSTAPIADRLSAAARQPTRDLVAVWHRDSLSLPEDHPIRSAFLALGLATVLSTLGLRRPD